jgi:hypothetical protein
MRRPDLDILQSILAARGGFGHREHLELVWNYLRVYETEDAQRAMASAIKHVASAHGAPEKYHETITRCWVHLVAVHRAGSDADTFDEFIAGNRGLLDRQLLDGHYSRSLLGSARRGPVGPSPTFSRFRRSRRRHEPDFVAVCGVAR